MNWSHVKQQNPRDIPEAFPIWKPMRRPQEASCSISERPTGGRNLLVLRLRDPQKLKSIESGRSDDLPYKRICRCLQGPDSTQTRNGTAPAILPTRSIKRRNQYTGKTPGKITKGAHPRSAPLSTRDLPTPSSTPGLCCPRRACFDRQTSLRWQLALDLLARHSA